MTDEDKALQWFETMCPWFIARWPEKSEEVETIRKALKEKK